MAKVLDEFPKNKLHQYPWDTWLDSRIWELARAVDFPNTKLGNFRNQAYRAATTRGLKIRVTMDSQKQTVVIQAYNPNPPGKQSTTTISPILKETRKNTK